MPTKETCLKLVFRFVLMRPASRLDAFFIFKLLKVCLKIIPCYF